MAQCFYAPYHMAENCRFGDYWYIFFARVLQLAWYVFDVPAISTTVYRGLIEWDKSPPRLTSNVAPSFVRHQARPAAVQAFTSHWLWLANSGPTLLSPFSPKSHHHKLFRPI